MAKPKKTKEQVSEQFYLNKSDIRKLFGVGYQASSKLYSIADEMDQKSLGKWRIEPFKVRITTVCKIVGITVDDLREQIKRTA